MLSTFALSLFETALNTALRTDAITQTALASQLNGKSIRITLNRPKVCVDAYIDKSKIRLSKIFDTNPANQAQLGKPDCIITADTVILLISLISNYSHTNQNTTAISGNSQMMLTLQQIIANSRINLSTLIQPFLGASISGQLEQALTNLKNQTQKTSAQAQFYANEWLTEDNDLLAKHWQMQKFSEDTETFSTNVDSLEAKIARLKELQKQQI